VILRPHREPASRIAWIVMIIALPVVGMIAYLFLGETNIGRRRRRRIREVLAGMPGLADAAGSNAPALQAQIPERYEHLFRVGHSVNGFEPVGGNRGQLLLDSNASIESMVADIDAAKDHVHVIFSALMTAIEVIPQQYSHEDTEGRLWDVLWMASLAARRAKPGCSRIVFEGILHIEGTRRRYQTLVLDIGTGDISEPVITIGFPADF
jgi:phosphatidylserine/phosphatidylglycerophosphate/cardiolipin synthase-like enzyme